MATDDPLSIEEIYRFLQERDHILQRPDTYVGSTEMQIEKHWIYSNNNNKMEKKVVKYVPALLKIFDEVLVNAADHYQNHPDDVDTIDININRDTKEITVYNNGPGIPIVIHNQTKLYVPEMLFGMLHTGTNFNDSVKRTTGGRNGSGAKLANIFSTEFTIETACGAQRFKQVFRNNMEDKCQPIITQGQSLENWTKVSFKPDLVRFGLTSLDDDLVALMKERVVEVTLCLGETVKVYLDGRRVPRFTFIDYVNRFVEKPNHKIYVKVNDQWEVCICEADGQFEQVSFVNNVATIKGGGHVDCITDQVTEHIVSSLRRKNIRFSTRNIVKSHLFVFVKATVENPRFLSQMKDSLEPIPESLGCKLPEEFLKKVEKSSLMRTIRHWVDFKQAQEDLVRTELTSNLLSVPKLVDAHKAGTADSQDCYLILVEGDSAKALAMSGLDILGHDYYGVYPLKGKPLNVMTAPPKQLEQNTEIQDIIKIMGLRYDVKYESTDKLRYGHVLIMADQDNDGSHIKGLVINIFNKWWPSLLQNKGFLLEFITPLLKATHMVDGHQKSFYTFEEYKLWQKEEGVRASDYYVKFYKGLATNTRKEAMEYFSKPHEHIKRFVWEDAQDGAAIELVFGKRALDRREWLKSFKPGAYINSEDECILLRDFVNKELILFSLANNRRSIPSMVDGLKPSQRKVVHCAFKKKLHEEMKVSQFIGYVSEHCAYHHSEYSLEGTIIRLAQDFVGSNNINLFSPIGLFGTRNMGGHDQASARYLFTKLSDITRSIFDERDDILLKYLVEDGESVEPDWFIPIIPMILVNGCEGVGSGWSTHVPCYHPLVIISNLKRMLKEQPLILMYPWYRGFLGEIKKDEFGSYITRGLCEQINQYIVRITELPIGKWTEAYKEFLDSACPGGSEHKKPPILSYTAKNSDEKVHFEVVMKEERVDIEDFIKKYRLTERVKTDNMHLFNKDGVIQKYETPEDILREFLKIRIEYYGYRKEDQVKELKESIEILKNEEIFITSMINNQIVLSGDLDKDCLMLREKKFLPLQIVEGRKTEFDYLLFMPVALVNSTHLLELKEKITQKRNELVKLEKIDPKDMYLADLEKLEKKLDNEQYKLKDRSEPEEKVGPTLRSGRSATVQKKKTSTKRKENDEQEDYEAKPPAKKGRPSKSKEQDKKE